MTRRMLGPVIATLVAFLAAGGAGARTTTITVQVLLGDLPERYDYTAVQTKELQRELGRQVVAVCADTFPYFSWRATSGADGDSAGRAPIVTLRVIPEMTATTTEDYYLRTFVRKPSGSLQYLQRLPMAEKFYGNGETIRLSTQETRRRLATRIADLRSDQFMIALRGSLASLPIADDVLVADSALGQRLIITTAPESLSAGDGTVFYALLPRDSVLECKVALNPVGRVPGGPQKGMTTCMVNKVMCEPEQCNGWSDGVPSHVARAKRPGVRVVMHYYVRNSTLGLEP